MKSLDSSVSALREHIYHNGVDDRCAHLAGGLRKTSIDWHAPQSSVSVIRELIRVNWVCAMSSLCIGHCHVVTVFSDSYGIDSSIRTLSIALHCVFCTCLYSTNIFTSRLFCYPWIVPKHLMLLLIIFMWF